MHVNHIRILKSVLKSLVGVTLLSQFYSCGDERYPLTISMTPGSPIIIDTKLTRTVGIKEDTKEPITEEIPPAWFKIETLAVHNQGSTTITIVGVKFSTGSEGGESSGSASGSSSETKSSGSSESGEKSDEPTTGKCEFTDDGVVKAVDATTGTGGGSTPNPLVVEIAPGETKTVLSGRFCSGLSVSKIYQQTFKVELVGWIGSRSEAQGRLVGDGTINTQ